MTSIVRPASRPPLLLSSPESDYITAEEIQIEPTPEQFMPAGFEKIVATAAFNYAAKINVKGGQPILKLNPEDQKIAVGVIFDAIQLAQIAKGQTDLPAKPKELRGLIKTGLQLRETERLSAKRLVDELKSVSYDLGLDENLVTNAKLEAYNYQIVPRPTNARKLIDMVPARRQAVERMAVIAATSYMAEHQGDLSEAMPTDKFIALNLGFVSELLNTEGKQASVDRGAIVATVSGKKGRGVNPTFLEPKDLKQMTAVFSNSKNVREIPELAAQTAGKLLAHSPELIPTGTAAMEAFGGQVRQAIVLAAKVDASHPNNPIAALTARSEIFSIFPTQPLNGSTALITRAELLATADKSTHHLWEDGLKVGAGPGELVLIPTPERLIAAKAYLGAVNRTGDERLDDDRLRLDKAIKEWQRHETVKTTLPDRIKKLKRQIRELSAISKGKLPSSEAGMDKLHPLQLDTMILVQSGRISAQSRRIHQHETALANQRQLYVMAEADPHHFAKRYLIYTQSKVANRRDAYERAAGEKDQSPSFRLTNFPRRSMDKNEPEALNNELTRLRSYLAELDKDKSKPLPDEFITDRTALWNYLRLGKTKHDLGLITRKEFDRMSTGMQILAAPKDASMGTKFWREWFIDQAKRRVASLETQSHTADRYKQDKAILAQIQSAIEAKDPDKIQETARQVSEGPQRIPLKNWIQMQTVPPELLGKSRAMWKNWKEKEVTDLKQAKRLVRLAREAQAIVKISIPAPDRIQQAIDEKRRAAQNYKSAKAATLSVLDELELAWKNRNSFVPLEVSQGATLTELINATDIRIDAAQAGPEIAELNQAKDKAKEELERLKKLRELGKRSESLGRLKDRLEEMKGDLAAADDRLVEAMQRLNLAANPQLIRQTKPSKK